MKRRRRNEPEIDQDKGDKLAKVQLEGYPINIGLDTLQLLFSMDNGPDLLALYVFYQLTSRFQSTNQVYATTNFVAKGCGWSANRVRNRKASLKKLGLIDDIYKRGDNGRIERHFIHINFHHPNDLPLGGKRGGEMLRDINIKEKVPKRNKKPESFEELIELFPIDFKQSKQFSEAYQEYHSQRIENKRPLTSSMVSGQLKSLHKTKLDPEESAIVVNRTVSNGWTGLFFEDHSKRIKNQNRFQPAASAPISKRTNDLVEIFTNHYVSCVMRPLDSGEREQIIEMVESIIIYYGAMDIPDPEKQELFRSGAKDLVRLYGENIHVNYPNWKGVKILHIKFGSKPWLRFENWLWRDYLKRRKKRIEE